MRQQAKRGSVMGYFSEKEDLLLYSYVCRQKTTKGVLKMNDIISTLTMKELEQMTYRALQKSFSQVMAQTLHELDEAIALGRDKKRFYLKDKRTLKFESVFGQVELKRNYYQDKETGKYIYLLDQYLSFDYQCRLHLFSITQEVELPLA